MKPGDGPPGQGEYHPATIAEYQPNRVTVRADGPGYLVLTDIMYPGWECTVDGRPAQLYRGNYLFRAVELPAGAHEVVFTFAPASYRLGRLVSAGTLVLVVGLTAAGLLFKRMKAEG